MPSKLVQADVSSQMTWKNSSINIHTSLAPHAGAMDWCGKNPYSLTKKVHLIELN